MPRVGRSSVGSEHTTNDQKREPTPVDTIAEEWVDTQLELYPEFHVWLGRPGREGEYADYSPPPARSTPSAR
ncbi:hypothetical protein [Sinomonas atrocyanea]